MFRRDFLKTGLLAAIAGMFGIKTLRECQTAFTIKFESSLCPMLTSRAILSRNSKPWRGYKPGTVILSSVEWRRCVRDFSEFYYRGTLRFIPARQIRFSETLPLVDFHKMMEHIFDET